MAPVPWRYVHNWRCTACGRCCSGFKVVLGFDEWLSIVEMYGVGVTETDGRKFYLRRRPDGTCVFLYNFSGMRLCGLQDAKPRACKLWPFKVLTWPKYGNAEKASYPYLGRTFYVYVDPECPEISWGPPSWTFTHQVIPEFIELAVGIREKQEKSTSDVPKQHPLYLKARMKLRSLML